MKNEYHPVVHCPCGEEMQYIYDPKIRKYCYLCTMEMSIEYAKDILGIKGSADGG